MILVAEQAILSRGGAVVTGLATVLLDCTELGCEVARIALLVALQVWPALFDRVAGETAAVAGDAEMWLMVKARKLIVLACH